MPDMLQLRPEIKLERTQKLEDKKAKKKKKKKSKNLTAQAVLS